MDTDYYHQLCSVLVLCSAEMKQSFIPAVPTFLYKDAMVLQLCSNCWGCVAINWGRISSRKEHIISIEKNQGKERNTKELPVLMLFASLMGVGECNNSTATLALRWNGCIELVAWRTNGRKEEIRPHRLNLCPDVMLALNKMVWILSLLMTHFYIKNPCKFYDSLTVVDSSKESWKVYLDMNVQNYLY